MTRLLLLLLRGYQSWISPLLGPRCRFAPTCSSYATTAIGTHGAPYGLLLTLVRLGKCHPFHPGGHDPVPLVRPRWARIVTVPFSTSPAPSPAHAAASLTRRTGADPC